jgi:diaminopimelate decarboxylase
MDKKQTGNDGFNFLLVNGGMEVNSRPLLYGSKHPFYIVSKSGELLSSEDNLKNSTQKTDKRIIVGRCCESGDSFTLDSAGHIVPRLMADPETGDYIVIGGSGAYCSSMTPFNYNSHVQIPEVLVRSDNSLKLIRKRQTLLQIVENEISLDD